MSRLFQLLLIVDPAAPLSTPRRAIDFKCHVNLKVIPPNVPIPPTALPIEITKGFTKLEIEEAFGFVLKKI